MTPHHNIAVLLRTVSELLQISRPLATFDLESTGVNPELDRIVQITVARIEPNGDITIDGTLVNPCVAIPPEASAVHGLTNELVKSAPAFKAIASRVYGLLEGADLIGYNHRRFDVRMVAAECKRVSLGDPCAGARLIDVGLIFMKREPRTLEAAMPFYCGVVHEDAHGTDADVEATLRVLLGQFDRYADLPHDIDALDALARDPSFVDRDGKIVWRNGEACIAFGKNQGVPLKQCDWGFFRWMLDKDFPEDTKQIVRDAMSGKYPVPQSSRETAHSAA
jgi:DNA polymerase-3 subunit epsilon